MEQRVYPYVGPKHIATRAQLAPRGTQVEAADDVRRWIEESHQEIDRSGSVTATFVVDTSGRLRIADRRSEHVACAGGAPVQSAGEITFAVSSAIIDVAWVTNQSTGYCPEPDSWPAVKEALARAGLRVPSGFSQRFIFRRCVACGSINIVKNGIFECGVCSADLPEDWNFMPDPLLS